MVYPYTEKGQRLFKWLGISTAPAPPLNAMFCILAGFLAALFLPYMWLYRSGNLNYQGFTVDAFRQTGWSIETSAVILIWAIVQTSLSEEILFRGFFVNACAINLRENRECRSGTHFGMVHITALPDKNIPALCVIVLLTGGIGYALGWLSLQKAQGSILYGWAIHAAVNILSPLWFSHSCCPRVRRNKA